jgi:hypothetical protein
VRAAHRQARQRVHLLERFLHVILAEAACPARNASSISADGCVFDTASSRTESRCARSGRRARDPL